MVGRDKEKTGLIQVVVELWLGENPGEPFKAVSNVGSRAELMVRDGTKVGDLLQRLALSYPWLGTEDPSGPTKSLRTDLIIIINGSLVPKNRALAKPLNEGDEVRLVPLYAGG